MAIVEGEDAADVAATFIAERDLLLTAGLVMPVLFVLDC